ncbi:MAG: hypothetical protein Fur002_09290 [Anaerolineales bacterium]
MANNKNTPKPSLLDSLPKRTGAIQLASKPQPEASAPTQPAAQNSSAISKFAAAFWTTASVISLTVNIVLLLILFFVFSQLRRAGLADLTKIGPNLLGGLYQNFELMDEAHIAKTIPVSAQIPVKFDLQLNQQTNVVLSENVVIPNALVTVNTGGLNINRASASIILPQGTSLPVFLNLTVPVDTSIPVELSVSVDIPLNETQLHDPFVGLQAVVKPLYCLFDARAKNGKGDMICK